MTVMTETHRRIQQLRQEAGWSQQEVATRCGVSRAAVSAIEAGRIVPSVTTGIRLAALFGLTAEALFASEAEEAWAWEPRSGDGRFWRARVADRNLRVPVEETHAGMLPHASGAGGTAPVLLMAGCDPAAGLLKQAADGAGRCTVIPLIRSTAESLSLLKRGLVHCAGIHADASRGNTAAARRELGPGYGLIRVAEWEAGVAVLPGSKVRTVAEAFAPGTRWVLREPGSVARSCFDQLCEEYGFCPRRNDPVATSHRAVAMALRQGWAGAGLCVRIAAEEAGLNFLSLRRESYDLCYRLEQVEEVEIAALVATLRTSAFRRSLGDVPGYDTRHTGVQIDVQ